MTFAQFFIELLKATAWPSLILFLAVFFRREIRALIPRMRKAGLSGVEFQEEQEASKPKLDITEMKHLDIEGRKPLPEIPGFPRTDVMSEIERSLHNDLALVDKEKREGLLIRQLAQSRLEAGFERVLANIFGSQIEGLQLLEKEGGVVSRARAEEFYGDVQTRVPFLATHHFLAWATYLEANGLIAVKNDLVTLTPLGRDFLLFLKAKGITPQSKPS